MLVVIYRLISTLLGMDRYTYVIIPIPLEWGFADEYKFSILTSFINIIFYRLFYFKNVLTSKCMFIYSKLC